MPIAKLTPTQVAALREVMKNLDQAKELREHGSVAAIQAEHEVRYTLRAVLKAIDEQEQERDTRPDLLEALEYVMQDDGLIPRATSQCRKVVAAAILKAKGEA